MWTSKLFELSRWKNQGVETLDCRFLDKNQNHVKRKSDPTVDPRQSRDCAQLDNGILGA